MRFSFRDITCGGLAHLLSLALLTGIAAAEAPGGRPLAADLLDENEVPAVDSGAFGFADARLNQGQGAISLDLFIADTAAPVTRIHIHRAPAGANGPIEVFFFDTVVDPSLDPIEVGPDGVFLSFVADGLDRRLAREIRQSPEAFYVNVHTVAFPAGELRGQLFKPRELETMLAGANEVPPVETDAFGMAEARFDLGSGSIALDLTIVDTDTPVTRIHIHRAPAGANGPIEVFFFDTVVDPSLMPFETGGGVQIEFVAEMVDLELMLEILESPEEFYVNVHTMEHPAGELRGQLGD